MYWIEYAAYVTIWISKPLLKHIIIAFNSEKIVQTKATVGICVDVRTNAIWHTEYFNICKKIMFGNHYRNRLTEAPFMGLR